MIPEVPCDHLLGHSDPVVRSSCSSDSTGERPVPPVRPTFDRSRSGTACEPTTHPGAREIHKVVTRSAYGIAVRDDGLACFTEPYQGGVGITSAQSRTALWFIPTGDIPTRVEFSPDGATAYVTNQYSQNVGVIDVAGAQQVATISLPPPNPAVWSGGCRPGAPGSSPAAAAQRCRCPPRSAGRTRGGGRSAARRTL